MNFNLNKENYNFFRELLINDFSKFTLTIKNSNIFYKNNENDVLFINKINQLKYFYDFKNFENIFSAENQIFNIPYKIKLRDNKYKKQIVSDISFDYLNLKLKIIIIIEI
jgi:disulfide oxidoreductase YuzD